VGVRVLELLSYREKAPRRKPEVLDILKHIHRCVRVAVLCGAAWVRQQQQGG
jgi:hypothetical protein